MRLINCSKLNICYHQEAAAECAGKSYGERITTEYEFDYILSSNHGKIITEGECVDLVPGMFFVRPLGTRVEGIMSYSSWYLRFKTEEQLNVVYSPCSLPKSLCDPIFRKIYDIHIQKTPDYQYEIDYYVNTLLFYLYQEWNSKRQNANKEHPLFGMREEIENTWNKNYSLDYYAKMSGYSKSRFCHLFRELYNVSPIQFLHELRLQKICYQLIETERPVKELMIENGYMNEQSFFRLFKAHTGETPLSYRKNHRFK